MQWCFLNVGEIYGSCLDAWFAGKKKYIHNCCIKFTCEIHRRACISNNLANLERKICLSPSFLSPFSYFLFFFGLQHRILCGLPMLFWFFLVVILAACPVHRHLLLVIRFAALANFVVLFLNEGIRRGTKIVLFHLCWFSKLMKISLSFSSTTPSAVSIF